MSSCAHATRLAMCLISSTGTRSIAGRPTNVSVVPRRLCSVPTERGVWQGRDGGSLMLLRELYFLMYRIDIHNLSRLGQYLNFIFGFASALIHVILPSRRCCEIQLAGIYRVHVVKTTTIYSLSAGFCRQGLIQYPYISLAMSQKLNVALLGAGIFATEGTLNPVHGKSVY